MLPLIVLKIGSSSITQVNGELDEAVIASVAKQISEHKDKYRWLIVSSGAVACGKKYIQNYDRSLSKKKAAASVGNPLLMATYSKYFAQYNICVGQSLCEREHFSDRKRFLQLKDTLQMLWESNIIPIANENDVVSSLELKFSDNDELATLMGIGLEADTILFGTSVPGLLDAEKKVIREVKQVNDQVLSMATTEKSFAGLGGMTSKLTFARLATRLGIKVHIFGLKDFNSINQVLENEVGTFFSPQAKTISARKKWLASGCLVSGKVSVDKGASKALLERKSLLAVGITEIAEDFAQGEIFEIYNDKNQSIGLAKSKHNSSQIKKNLKTKNFEVAHADEIILI